MIVANGGTPSDAPLPGLRPDMPMPDPATANSVGNASGLPPASMPAGRVGMLGGRQMFNPKQRYGDGYDPVTGAMSLSGGASQPGAVPPGAPSLSGMIPNDPSAGGTGIPGLDNTAPLNLTPQTLIMDGSKGGVNDTIHPGFFQHGGLGQKIAGGIGNMMIDMAAAGGDPMAMMTLRQRGADQDAQRQFGLWNAQEIVRRQQQLQDRNYEDNQKPRYFSSEPGAAYNVYNPASGRITNLYQAPTQAQNYAANFGEPGSDQYQKALQDFYLKTYGPTALAGRQQLDDYRSDNRAYVKGLPTYSDLHPRQPAPRPARAPTVSNVVAGIMTKAASGQPLNAQEQQIFNSQVNGRYGGRGRGGGGITTGAPAEGTIISNPSTGQRMKMQGGKWVAI
jgi:hypothetical protein